MNRFIRVRDLAWWVGLWLILLAVAAVMGIDTPVWVIAAMVGAVFLQPKEAKKPRKRRSAKD